MTGEEGVPTRHGIACLVHLIGACNVVAIRIPLQAPGQGHYWAGN
jgi:hypothetical protein